MLRSSSPQPRAGFTQVCFGRGSEPHAAEQRARRLQHASPDRPCLVGDGEAARRIAPGVDVAELEPLRHVQAGVQQAADHACKPGAHRFVADVTDHGAGLDHVADLRRRAPRAGAWRAAAEIGDVVEAGAVVGHVGDEPVRAGLAGVVRGLLYPGLDVTEGFKLGDVDPRGDPARCFTVSDKARAVGGGVLEAACTLLGGVRFGAPAEADLGEAGAWLRGA